MPPAKCPRKEAPAPENDLPSVVHMAVLGKADAAHHADAPDAMDLWHCFVYEGPLHGFRYLEARPDVGALLQVDPLDQKVYIYRAEIDIWENLENSDSDPEEESAGIIYTSTLVTIVKLDSMSTWRPHRRVRPGHS